MSKVQSKGELVFAGLLLALGIFVLIDTTTIEIPRAASNVGPRFVPYAVGLLLTLSAGMVLIGILRGDHAAPEEGELVDADQPVDLRRTGIVVGAVIAFAVLITPLGYVPATAISFFAIAFALGARYPARLAVASVAVALIVYLAFTRGLGIYLPPGLLEGIL